MVEKAYLGVCDLEAERLYPEMSVHDTKRTLVQDGGIDSHGKAEPRSAGQRPSGLAKRVASGDAPAPVVSRL